MELERTRLSGDKRIKSVQMQLTTECNQRCVFCRKYTWEPKTMPLDILEEKIKKYKHATFQFSGGEPTMYSFLWKLNILLKRYSIPYKVYTNLSMYIPEDTIGIEQVRFLLNAEEISISLDALDKKVYDSVRRPVLSGMVYAFDNVFRNIHWLVEEGKKEALKLCMVINKMTIGQVPKMVEFCNLHEIRGRFYPLHTNMETAISEDDLRWLEKELYNTGWLGIQDSDEWTNVKDLFEPGYFSIRRDFIDCKVRNRHRVIDEEGREYVCCYAINDNGEDIDGFNALNKYILDQITAGEKLREDTEEDCCHNCSRYRRANEDQEYLEEVRFL